MWSLGMNVKVKFCVSPLGGRVTYISVSVSPEEMPLQCSLCKFYEFLENFPIHLLYLSIILTFPIYSPKIHLSQSKK